MARIQTVTLLQPGTSQTLPTDINKNPFNVSVFVEVTGTVNYTVNATGDDLQKTPAVTPVWIPHTILASQTTSQASNYAFPVTGIQVVMNSGSGSLVMNVIQAGIGST